MALPGLGNRPDRPTIDSDRARERLNNRQDWMNDRVAHRDDRRNGLQDRLDNRNDRWNDWRTDRWNRRDDVREDWQDWAGRHWRRHNHWHHGFWHHNHLVWWSPMWNRHPVLMALGVTRWGIHRVGFWFGYWRYFNPFFVRPIVVAPQVVINYSQPLTVLERAAFSAPAPVASETPGAPAPSDPAEQAFDRARQAFFLENYDEALAAIDTALAAQPDDAVLHEFRALVMFATGQYDEAAAGLHAVLAVGPGWDWTTLSSLYASVDTYTRQLRALEDYTRQNDPATAARFVLAYHYLTCGHTDEAVTQLRAVLAAQPDDEVIAMLLEMHSTEAETAQPSPPPPAVADAPSVTIPQADLLGVWRAQGQDGAAFSLELTEGGQFVWTYSAADGDETKVQGVFALDGANLALELDAGGTMLAEITPPADGTFHFLMVGGPEGDPGLDFRR